MSNTGIDRDLIIPAKGIDLRRLDLGALEVIALSYRRVERTKVDANIKAVLSDLIPRYVDKSVRITDWSGDGEYLRTIDYTVLLSHGQVDVKLIMRGNIGRMRSPLEIHGDPYLSNAPIDQGPPHLIFQGTYRWRTEDGKPLLLGRTNGYCDGGFSSSYSSLAFMHVLNALCHGTTFPNEILSDTGLLSSPPINYSDGNGLGVSVSLRNPSLEVVREAEPSVAEFMRWLYESKAQVNTIGEYVRSAVKHHQLAELHRRMAEAGDLKPDLAALQTAEQVRYLDLARSEFAQLQPPQNNRMDYLVRDTTKI